MRPILPILLALAGPAASQGITLVEGPAPNNLSVRVLDEANPTAPGQVLLQRAELLPIEITARTVQQEWDTTHARRIGRHGFFRIELPGGGRLFQYRRDGGQWYGYLWVKADGTAEVLLETAGTGLTGTESPFADRIAVRPDGAFAAVPGVAGGLTLVRLDGGTYASTGTNHRLLGTSMPVEPASVLVGRNFVFYHTEDDRVWRCGLADGAMPVDVSPPPLVGARLKEEMAISGDGRAVVFIHGVRPQFDLWMVGEVGGPVRLPVTPGKFEEPGYLPEGPGHAELLLNHDATRLLYVDAQLRDELYVLDVSGLVPTLHLTGDPIFRPYIGVHILPSFLGTTLVLAIGDINALDWFRVEGTGQVSNLTRTGTANPPYGAGTLNPENALATGPNVVLSTEQTAAGLRLRRIDPATLQSVVVEGALSTAPEPGSTLGGRADLLVQTPSGDRLYDFVTGSPLVATPPGILLTPPNRGGPGGGITGTFVHIAAGFGIPVFVVPGGPALAGLVEHGLKQVVMTANGAVLNGNTVRYLAPGTFVTLPLPAASVRWVISGAGG